MYPSVGRVSLLNTSFRSEVFPNTPTSTCVTPAGTVCRAPALRGPGGQAWARHLLQVQGGAGSRWSRGREAERLVGCLQGFLGRKCLFCCLCDLRIHHQWGRTCKKSKTGRKEPPVTGGDRSWEGTQPGSPRAWRGLLAARRWGSLADAEGNCALDSSRGCGRALFLSPCPSSDAECVAHRDHEHTLWSTEWLCYTHTDSGSHIRGS